MDLRETLMAAIDARLTHLARYDDLLYTLDLHALLAALDELDALKAENAETDALNTRLARILTDTAHALKGTPEALHSHSWADLAQVAAKLVDERDALKGENSRLRERVRVEDWNATHELRAELADLRERAGRLHKELRRERPWTPPVGGVPQVRCGVCDLQWGDDEDERHVVGCMAAPGFLDAKEGGR